MIPFFLRKRKEGVLPITDVRMTRFWITLTQGASLVLNALKHMRGGETWVPKIPSMRIVDLAQAMAPECEHRIVGIRPGEKLHEVMIPVDDGRNTLAFGDHFVIKPTFPTWDDGSWDEDSDGERCPDGFYFGSDNNTEWLDAARLKDMVAELDLPEAEEWAAEQDL